MPKGKTTAKTVPAQRVLSAVTFSSLHFDPQNPRREPMEDEADIRRVLCEDEGVLMLAQHISEHGQNPLARIAVIDHPALPGHYIVPEGNRRLCAMQLLRDPERAPTPTARKTFERLKKTGRPMPDTLEAVWFSTREVASPWLSVNHEGEQGGIGTVAWGTAEKARFNRGGERSAIRPKNPNVQALHLVDYATNRGLISPEQRNLISLTTLTRYLPSLRATLALENSEDCTTRADREQFNAALQRFLIDAIPSADPLKPSPVHSRSKAADWKAYSVKLHHDGVSPTDRSHVPYDPMQAPPPKPAAKAAQRRSTTHPDRRKYLIPGDFVVPYKDPVLQRMVVEGKQHTDCEENRFGANYLIRAILEKVVHKYAKSWGIGTQRELEPTITAVRAHAGKQATPPSRGIINVLNTAASSNGAKYGPQALGNGVHGGKVPTASDNRSNWETLQPALQYLMDHTKK